MKNVILPILLTGLASPVLAESHLSESAAHGEASFKFCQTCHVIIDDEGNTIAGKRSKTGPNLYGVIGRTAGTVEGYRYSKHMIAAGEAGLVWNEETIIAFLIDPKGYMQTTLDDPKARTKMTFKIRPDRKNDLTVGEVAKNFYDYLSAVGPKLETSEGDVAGEGATADESATVGEGATEGSSN